MLHVYSRRWLFAMLACILALSLLAACITEESGPTPTPEKSPQVAPIPVAEVSLEEAGEVLGMPVPVPAYLPSGYDLQRVFAYEGRPRLILLFSDEEIMEEVRTLQDLGPLISKVAQPGASSGPKLILLIDRVDEIPSPEIYESMAEQHGGKVVDIDGTKGWLIGGSVAYQLSWFQPRGLRLEIRAVKDLSEAEVIKIAESIG